MISSPHLPRFLALAVAAALAFVGGCDSAPHVQGSVTYDGQPVDGGGIAFLPEGDGDGEARLRVTGAIRDGGYDFGGRRAPSPGKYRVEITWLKKTGNKVPGEGGHPKDETQQVIPPRYNVKSELSVEVQAGHNSFDFNLEK
jgi:hypothetical protein